MKNIFLALLLFLTSCGTSNSDSFTTSGSKAPNSLSYLDVPENAEFILTTSHDHNTEGYNHLASLVFKAAVENKSNGRIGVKIYPNGQLAASGKEGIAGLLNGTLDIFKVTGDLPSFWAPAAMMDLPYILANDRIAEAVYGDTDFIEAMRQDILAKYPQLRLMMIASSGGWRNFATTKKEIKKPEDMKGLKIRTLPSRVQQNLVTSFGGAATAMPYAEVYTSLSTGVVDGANLSIVDIVNAKLHESLRYYILDNHSSLIAFWFINEDKLKSMPEDLRIIVADSFEDMRVWLNAYPKLAQVYAFEEFRAKGGKIYTPSPEELKAFKDSTTHIRQLLIEEYGQEVVPWLELFESKIKYHEDRLASIRKNETE